MSNDSLDAEYLRSILDYNADTGIFIWKHRPREHFATQRGMRIFNSQCAGKEAGHERHDGYLIIGLDSKIYLAHRLAWIWMTGKIPDSHIDHKDNDRRNLKWKNLRAATAAQNLQNQKRRSDNSSGHKGVYWNKAAQKWQAYITSFGTYRYLGLFSNPEDAYQARCKAAKELHGEFARVV